MAVVNPMLTPMFNPNVKDSRWLTLEVCREFQRTKCSRTENECKFAHPPPHVEVQNGRVTCCFDSIKGKCQRKEPPCKYLHPPQHLREQLLQNGRNNLILKNLQMQYIAAGLQPTMIPQVFPAQADQSQGPTSASPEYRASPNPTYYTYEQVPPYVVSQNPTSAYTQFALGVGGAAGAASTMPTMLSTVDATAAAAAAAGSTPTSQVLSATGAKLTRPDRLEPSSASSNGTASNGDIATTTVGGAGWSTSASSGSAANGVVEHTSAASAASTSPLPQYSPVYLQNSMGGLPGMVPVMKRPALDNKSGIPMAYQPSAAAAYQQAALAAMQLQQQPGFVPVSIAGHTPSVPRF